MFCLYCGNKLPDDALFCNRCGKRQKGEQEVSTSGEIIQPGVAFPGAFISGGQPSVGNVPMVQGTPQPGTVPTPQGTPTHLNPPPTGQALSQNIAPSSSSFSAPSQAPTSPGEPPTSSAHYPYTERPPLKPGSPPTYHPRPEHQGLQSRKQTLAGHVTRRTVITGLVGVTTVAAAGGLAVGVLSGKLKTPFLPGSSTPPPASAPVLANTNFPMFGFDPQHTHFNPSEYILNPENVARLTLYWTVQTEGAITSSPAVVNGVVYIGSGDHKLYALNAKTGKVLWSYATGNEIESSPAVVNGIAYIGSNKLYALDAKTGGVLWTYDTGNFIAPSPTVANGIVYIGSNYSLYALDAETGTLLWSYATKFFVTSSPAVANGVVYVGSGNGDQLGKL